MRRQAPWVIACRVVGILSTLAGNILAARLLGPADFGRYLFLSSVAVCGGLLGVAGLADAALRFSSESLALNRRPRAAAYVRRITRLCITSTLLAAAFTATCLYALHLASGQIGDIGPLIILTVLILVALAWQQMASETLRGWNNLKLASLFSGGAAGGPISTILFLGGIIALWLAEAEISAPVALGLMAASVWITVPFALLCVWRTTQSRAASAEPAARLSNPETWQLVYMAGTMLALNLLGFVSEQADIWIGEVALGPAELGMYGVAKRSLLLAAMPVQMVMLVIIAAIPRLHTQGRRRELQKLMRGSAGIAAVPSLAALVLLVLFPGQVLSLLFGDSYSGGGDLIRILAVGYVVLVLTGNPINILALTGRHRSVLVVNLAAAAVLFVGGPLAAHWFGAYGLAGVSAAALATQNILLWWLAWRQCGVWTHVGLPHLAMTGALPLRPRAAARLRDKTAREPQVVPLYASEAESL